MTMRLDVYLVEKMGVGSRAKAQQLIKDGLVFVNGKCVNKPSYELLCNENITITEYRQYVSRGAYKLLGAIEAFGLDFTGKVVLDIGASTGGFTEVALEKGAKKIYSIDVGRGELAEKLKDDKRVVNMEGRDFRSVLLEEVKDADLIIGDISFISLRHIIPKIKELFGNIPIVILFKPQFECGKEIAKRYKGVIKNSAIHKSLLKDFVLYLSSIGYSVDGLTNSPITGKSGNIEYLFLIKGSCKKIYNVDEVVDNAFKNLKIKG